MQAKSDARLLRDYAEHGADSAFRELVTRHTSFVYSSALRQVEASAVAADITQGVFVDLARKAGSVSQALPPEASLAGWLHRSTRYAALNHLRDTRRRREHERQAMEQLLTNSDPAADWEQIRPALDEALDQLGDEDREALLLRYFKNQDFCAVGLALGVSDDVAQKRVSRAVERLREFFAKRGATVGAGGLVVLITANAVQAAPVGLVATISAAAVLAGTAVHTSTIIAVTKTIAMTTLQKTLITATLAVLAGAGIYEARQAAQLRERNQSLQQQQAPLAGQIQQLQHERDDATNRLAVLRDELAKGKSNDLELAKLRNEVTQFRQNGAERPATQQGRTLEWKSEKLINAGQATPENTLQTFLWALVHADLVELANCLVADATDPPPDEAIQRYVNDHMNVQVFSAYREFGVTSQTKISSEEMRLELKFNAETIGFFSTMVLRKVMGEWKIVVFNRRDTYGRLAGVHLNYEAQ